MSELRAFRGQIVHCLRDPGVTSDAGAIEYLPDGVLLVDDGHVAGVGPAQNMLQNLTEECTVTDCKESWILPGFIDCHVHYPQIDIIASYGERLLDWLNTYTYPAEAGFGDSVHARETADFFLDALLRNGTTSAMVFATVHPESVDAIFESAHARNMRIWSGKVLMDRHCPKALQDTADSAYRQSRALLEKWHGVGRLEYAITPRFAPTSSDRQLAAAGRLAGEFPEAHIHSHLAESHAEMAWVAELFPDHSSYAEVYEHYGLLRERSIYAHCLHQEDADVHRMASNGAAIAFCPSSNLFLGSGLFDLNRAATTGVRVGLGTDVGGGTSLNMFKTICDAYKTLQLRGQPLSAIRALYLATLGAARALYADDKLGNFMPGKEADFVVLDASLKPLAKRRLSTTNDVAEALFAMMILGDDRLVRQTYVMGKPVFALRD